MAICKYDGPAYDFLQIARLFPHWEASVLLLFSNPDMEAQIKRAGIRCARFPVPRFISRIPYLNLAGRVLLDAYHFIASFALYHRYARNVDVVFNMDNNPFGPGKWITRWARRAGTLTLRWTFGNISPAREYREHWLSERYLRMLGFEVEGFWGVQCHTQYTLVGSVHNRDLLARSGIPKEKMFVVGPYLRDKLDRLRCEHPRRESDGGRGILILTQPFGREGRDTIFRLAEGVEGIEGWDVTIKLHPRDDASLFLDWAAGRSGIRVVRHGEEAAEDLIARATVVIGFTSTTLAAALYLRKKVIFFRYRNGVETANYYGRYVRDFYLHGPENLEEIRHNISVGRLAQYERELLPSALEALYGQPGFTDRFDGVISSLLQEQIEGPAQVRQNSVSG